MTDGAATFGFVLAVVFVVAFMFGLRATWRAGNRWYFSGPPRRVLLLTLFGICLIVTAAAGIFGALSVRRIAGLPPLEWSAFVTTIAAIAVLAIPQIVDWVETQIEEGKA